MAGAALSQGQVSISWQAQHFRKVKYRFRGRRSTFARSSIGFVAGAALSQGAASTLCELGDGKMQKTLALCVNWASGLCRLRRLFGGGLGTVSERSRNGLGDGLIGTAARRFRKV